MQEDDHRVGGRSRLAHGLHEPRGVLRGREPGLAGTGGPRRDQLVVEHLGGADERDALPVDRAPERAIRLFRAQPDPDDREAVAARGGERVAEAGLAVVETVVVGHRRDIHTSGRERGEGARRRSEGERLGRRRPVRRDRCLEIHDGQVGATKHRADGREDEVGCGAKLRSDRPLEVDVTAERELDRPSRLTCLDVLGTPAFVAPGRASCTTAPTRTATASDAMTTARVNFTVRCTKSAWQRSTIAAP